MYGHLKAVRGRGSASPEPALNPGSPAGSICTIGFGEIRTPIFETRRCVARSVGEETDIVSSR